MPLPFILHTHEELHPNLFRRQITLHSPTRRFLTPFIKTSDWECYPLSRPIDCNPLCPEKYSLSRSHYNRLGIETDEDWSTATKDMFKYQENKKRNDLEVNPDKSLVNFFTSVKEEGPPIELRRKDCIPLVTTMQYCYPSHFPKSAKKTPKPEPPFLTNRKLAMVPGKFIDENYMSNLKQLQCNKIKRHISYDPMKDVYTDGKPAISPSHNIAEDYQELLKRYQI
ncbi:unnamed protein product [Psylliodes chrysocephalus]|uniref:Uncharacterized protein n=1 Tax=Psylliodes chrysocephalus TaxID=3402493 RepID=A0A9P0CSM8_9CUCU|nr:unnamed protein product [Psylliodes chrysocephala]